MSKQFFFISMLLCGIFHTVAAQEIVIKDIEGPSAMCEFDLRDFMYANYAQQGPSRVRQKSSLDGAVINYRDRITNMPQYFYDFIDQYVEAGREVLNGGSNWLSDPKLGEISSSGYYYLLNEVTGSADFTFPVGSGTDVVKAAAAAAFRDRYDEEYDILKSFMPYASLCVNYDYPEFFWIGNKFIYGCSSSSSISYTPSSGTGTVTYSIKLMLHLLTSTFDIRCIGVSTYNFRKTENLAGGVQTFNSAVQTILEQCQSGSSRYDKLLIAHDWLTQHNCYNRSFQSGYTQSQLGDTPWSPFSAIEGNIGQQAPVCEGYSRAFKVLCDRMDIPCILMSGNAHYRTSGGAHMWNYVQMESGKWYAIDVTWDDPGTSYDAVSGQESHDWFLLGSTTPLDDGQTFIESHPEQWLESYPNQGSYTWDLKPGPELSSSCWTPSVINTLTYIVDGEVYRTYEVESGTPIVPEQEPTKEGYTFSGWSEIPEIMPDGDVIVTGSFTINSYTLTYIVDGAEYSSFTVEYGSEIIPEPEPTMEGYTFSGWNGLPATMPAGDVVVTGTFSINQYKLIYLVDGEEYKSYDVDYDSEIIPEQEPVKKGMTFSGWGEVPETMPAHDVTLSGTFSWSEGTFDFVIYLVTDTLSNHASVIGNDNINEEAVIRPVITIGGDSYTVTSIGTRAFAACDGLTSVTIPATVTSIGTSAFSNCSMLTDVYCYAEDIPETNSDAFDASPIATATLHVPRVSKDLYKEVSPWSSFGNIVSLEGDDPEPILEKCASPTIAYQNGQLLFKCETEDVEFVSEITNEDIRKNFTAIVSLTATYHISVFASKPSFENSDTIQATLCWIDQQPATEGITDEDAVMEVKAQPILIQSRGSSITLQGISDGTLITIYGTDGRKYGSTVGERGFATINTSLQSGSIAIIKIGEKTTKVRLP